MSIRRIDELVWAALTDPVFCERMLNGHRREIVDSFCLPEAERRAALAAKADTLEAFAGALCRPGTVGR
jgi:hypothetical protein